jgi:hypothetical protein
VIRYTVRKTIGTAALGLALSTGVIAPASAEPNHWESFQGVLGPDVYEDFCGVPALTVEQTAVVDIRYRTVTHGADDLQYYYEGAKETDTYTNLATGEVLIVAGAGRGGAKSITDNGDGTLTVLVSSTVNNVFVSDGQVLGRNTGIFRYELRYDHGGTPADPTDDVFLGFQVVKDTGQKDTACSLVVQAIG